MCPATFSNCVPADCACGLTELREKKILEITEVAGEHEGEGLQAQIRALIPSGEAWWNAEKPLLELITIWRHNFDERGKRCTEYLADKHCAEAALENEYARGFKAGMEHATAIAERVCQNSKVEHATDFDKGVCEGASRVLQAMREGSTLL